MTTQNTQQPASGDKKTNTLVPAAILIIGIFISLAIIGSAFFFTQTNFYIKNLGTATTQDGKLTNTITVTGDGQVFAKPDMASLRLSVDETRDTSSAALEAVNQKISQIQSILEEQGVDSKDAQTSDLSIYTEYDWSNGDRKIVGQRASQSLSIKIKGVDESGRKVGQIIDEVSQVKNIELGSISFGLENPERFKSQARELAYQKAEQKAQELADLGEVRLLQPVSLTDTSFDVAQDEAITRFSEEFDSSSTPITGGAPTEVSTGQLEINLRVSAVFGIE
jgi:hypothetical protein